MKLTSKQQQALRHMKQESVQKHRFGYRDWRITGPSHPSVVGRVISLGLARWAEAPNTSDAQIAVLTDVGRAAIA